MWDCPICGHSNSEPLDFCENCGANRERDLEENRNDKVLNELEAFS